MTTRIARAAVPALAVALAGSCAAKTTQTAATGRGAEADKPAVTRLEQRWLADLARGDRDDLAAILADDYRDIDWRGRIRDKQALLSAITGSQDISQHVSQLHVRAWGDTAVATGTNEVHSASKGWRAEIAFTDVFARIDGHWRAVSSQETLRKSSTSGAHR